MSLLTIEGFESEKNTSLLGQTSSYASYSDASGGYMIDEGVYRSGKRSYKMWCSKYTNTAYSTLSRAFSTTKNVFIAGFGIKFNRLPYNIPIFKAGYRDNSNFVELQVSSTGYFQIKTTSGGLLGTGIEQYGTNAWYYIQIKAKSDPANGAVSLIIGKNTEIDLTNVNITMTSSIIDTFSWQVLGIDSNQTSMQIDDIYLYDTTDYYTNFLGVSSILGLKPHSQTERMDFDVFNASTAKEAIDEDIGNTTDYIQGDMLNKSAFFNMTDLSISAPVTAMIFYEYSAMSVEGKRTAKYKFIIKNSSNDTYENDTKVLDSTNYSYNIYIYEINPITELSQTKYDVDDLRAGFRVIDPGFPT